MAQRGKMQHVLVADDQFLFRSGVRTLLAAESNLRAVAEASTVDEAFRKGQYAAPEVVVISASLLAQASTEELRDVCRWTERAAFVLISESHGADPSNLIRQMGSPITIPRSTPAPQLVDAIRRAAWREEHGVGATNRTAADLEALAKTQSLKDSALTSREQEVVRLLAEGRTVRETAAELFLSIKTIDAHKLNVMRKLDIHNRQKLIEYAVSCGIVMQVPA